jgi:CheY-like chemotaxis protein
MATILIIEDEPAILDTIIDTLEAENYETYGAGNGQKGLEMARRHLPDLILCDVMMPVKDGFQVLKELRQDELTSTIPFIFLTAKSERKDMRQGMELGADDYIPKPFTAHELLSAVGTRLNKQRHVAEHYEKSMNELRRNIVYALPHEMRTPLQSILGFAEMLKMDADTLDGDQIRMMADHILAGSNRLYRLIENYLVYAQIEVMAAGLDQTGMLCSENAIDPGELITDVVQQKAAQYNRQDDVALELFYRPKFHIPEDDLRKIIDELADNAFKFSDKGKKVYLRSTKEDERFVLYLRDHGRGMSADQVDKLGAYMQFERALYEQQGVGLGFTVAHRLVDLHHGQLRVKSHPQHGTQIQLIFPVCHENA